MHVFVQMVCALVKPTIMARKMVRARRGTDPKRPAEPRRAERRHDREAAREHIGMTQSTIVLGSAVRASTKSSTQGTHREQGEWSTFAEEIGGDSGSNYVHVHLPSRQDTQPSSNYISFAPRVVSAGIRQDSMNMQG